MAEPYLRALDTLPSTPPLQALEPGPAERKLLSWLDGLEDESKSVEKYLKRQWKSNLSWYRGRQWMLRDRKPKFLVNKIGQMIRKKRAKLTEMKPMIKIHARRAGLMTTEAVLQKTIDAGWDEYGMQMVLSDLASHMLVYGCGFLVMPYDGGADYGRGDMVPAAFDPRYVHVDPSISRTQDLQDASYIWTSSIMPTWKIRRNWPVRGLLVDIKDQSGKAGEDEAGERLRRLFSALPEGEVAVQEAIPRSEVREYWFQDPTIGDDGKLKYPHGRHIIRSGNVILTDRPNPYHDGRYPLVMIDGWDDLEHPWGTSEVLQHRRLQDAVNRIGHMFVENTILTGNTWIVADQNALAPSARRTLSDIGAIILEKAVGRTIEREPPPQMPPHMMEFIGQSLQLMDEMAGLSDPTAAAQGRMEVRSDDQLEGLQQAAEVLIRDMARRVEAGLERFGQLWISRIFQFYTRDRTLAYMGPTAEWETFEFERGKLIKEIEIAVDKEIEAKQRRNEMTQSAAKMYQEATRMAWQYFTFRIEPGSSLASVRANRAMLHMSLADRGYISKKHALRDVGFANPEQEIDEAKKEAMILGAEGTEDKPAPTLRRAI